MQPHTPSAPPPEHVVNPIPAPITRRVLAIDVLRGAAILGILPMNMQLFAMIDGCFLNPYAGPWTDNLNVAVWVFLHVVIGHKDLAVFSMLFGAGILMVDARCSATGRRAAALHYRRMGVLAAFGVLHAYLIWSGDILFTYAMCGLVVYLLRNFRAGWLIALGAGAYAVPMCLLLVVQLAIPRLSPDQATDLYAVFEPTAEMIAEHNAVFGGGWVAQMRDRASGAIVSQTVVLFAGMGWVAGGMMLVGMGLHKLDVFTGRRTKTAYYLMIAAAAVIGFPLIVAGLVRNFAYDWHPSQAFIGGLLFSECAFPIVAVGWIGLIMLVCERARFEWLTKPVSAVGRMALTNYLMQSVICSLIFYGHGLGLVGRIDRVGQLGLTVAIWVAQLICSSLWLKRFHFGPVEWLWRTLSYGRLQPIRVGAAVTPAAVS